MQHNGPVNIVFTGLYVWVVPVTSGNLYCTNYLSTGNRYRLYISLKTISFEVIQTFSEIRIRYADQVGPTLGVRLIRRMYIVYYETENHYNSKVHAIVRMANFKVIRNLVSESLYEEISFYSFLGTRILSNYSKTYFASLSSLRYSS